MSLRSPQSPDFSRRGFQPLKHADSNPNMAYDSQDGIPLTQVKTGGSTGTRKAGSDPVDVSPQSTYQDGSEKKQFLHTSGGRRRARKASKKKRAGADAEEVAVNGLGRFYSKVINFSIVTRYFVYVLPIALLIAIPIIVYSILNKHALFGNTGVKVIWFWTWIEIVWLGLWVSKLVAKVIPWVFMFLCGVVSSGTRKYALILKAVEIPLYLVVWSVANLATFTALTNAGLNGVPKQKGWINVMRNLLGATLIACVIFLVEKIAIQGISVNYHRRSFANRIKESKNNIHLLGLLFEASRTMFPMYCHEFADEDYIINDSIEAILAKSTGHKKNGSVTPLRLIGNIGRVGDKVTSVFGNIASEIAGKKIFDPGSAHSIVVEALEKTRSSEALARRLWMSFVCEGKEALYAEDIEEVLGPARRDEAEEAFSFLDGDGNGDISLDEMIMKIVEIGKDRKAMAASMRDVGQAIGVLDSVLSIILFVIIIFIFVAFQKTSFITTLATAGTTLLSLSFVFAVSVQEFLGSCIFLFIKHPYDVADRVDIVGPSGVEFLVVEQISLLYTVFKRIDNMKVVQVPNIVLNTVWVENVTRSKAMKEQLEMFISFDTTLEDIELLRVEMESFVKQPENSRDFQKDIILEATGIGNMDKLQLRVGIRHKSNWHNETVRAARRSKFMCALVLALRKIPIYPPGGGAEPLGGPTNPGYTVAINDTWAAEARDKAKEAKEEKRAFPTPVKDEGTSGKSSGVDTQTGERNAAEMLNMRRPGMDSAHRDTDTASYVLRDDDTLSGREDSLERHRSNEIETMRNNLLKSESTRGRRRPGEHMPDPPSMGVGGPPGLSITQASPRLENFMSSTSQVLDEESEVGIHPTSSQGSQQGLFSGNSYVGAQQPQSSSYSMYPPTHQQSSSGSGRPPPGFSNIPLGSQPPNGPGQGPSRR